MRQLALVVLFKAIRFLLFFSTLFAGLEEKGEQPYGQWLHTMGHWEQTWGGRAVLVDTGIGGRKAMLMDTGIGASRALFVDTRKGGRRALFVDTRIGGRRALLAGNALNSGALPGSCYERLALWSQNNKYHQGFWERQCGRKFHWQLLRSL